MNPKNNPKNLELNSKWTSVESRLGWRHFRIVMRRYREIDRGADKILELELMAACDRNARVWISASELKSTENFREGWLKDLATAIQVTTRDLAGGSSEHSHSPSA
ncbi:MAG: TIGR02450 family Trp-rich protein [Oligoflexus sp.]|nr:TIGR02450 family Trp-rich protein [Oligoflexus sp.]